MELRPALAQEWVTLQNNYERYEGGALLIKLSAVLVFAAIAGWGFGPWPGAALVLLLWLQEGIFRTFQSRLGVRLLELEKSLAGNAGDAAGAFQLHSRWLAARGSTAGLLAEYIGSACRPTVAFPYAVLLLLIGVLVSA